MPTSQPNNGTGGIPVERTFCIGGQEYHGREVPGDVLMIDGKPEIGDEWQNERGIYRVVRWQLPHQKHGRHVVQMALFEVPPC